jgi:death-on-curing protein
MAEHYEAADLVRQAALLAVGLSQNQPFLDGNKRTAFFAMLVFLDLNGLELESGADEPLAQALIRVAERSGDVESATHRFEAWLRGHIAPRRG